MRYVLAMLLMVPVGPAQAEDFPQHCYKELMLVTLDAFERRCPGFKLTFAGHRQKTYLAGSPDKTCLSAAQSKSRRDADELGNAWCPLWQRMLNAGRPEQYVGAR